MYDEPAAAGNQDEEEPVQTQEDSQSTQPTQTNNELVWGYLNPCVSQLLERIYLLRETTEIGVGRNDENHIVLPGYKISNFHAIIRWNGEESNESLITIDDMSSNGTFINGVKIGKGKKRLLKDGDEVAFGVSKVSRDEEGLYDYRYIFRDLVSGVIKRELYNSYDMSVELGKGSFATVYKALHISSGEWVAVKVIHETKRHTGSAVPDNGQSREITIMQTLRHPNICLLREVFWNANGSIDLVLELVEGGDLLDFILKSNGLNEHMSKHITYQLCKALSYIHGKGITHRDLKPENVLLTKDKPPIVKVADFGLAKIVDSMTMLRTMCGTPSYLAPEVVSQQNSSGYDSLVDSWSVGVILFSMLSNTNPFLETSVEDIKTRILERTIDWTQLDMLRYGNPDQGYFALSEEVKDFIRLLLEEDPRQRMTLTAALTHPWLADFTVAYPATADSIFVNGSGSGPSEDVSMRTAGQLSFSQPSESETDAVSQGFEHLKLQASGSSTTVPTTSPDGDSGPAPRPADVDGREATPALTPSQERRKGALQRRSEVLAHAVDTGSRLVEPSWEMVEYAQSQSQDPDRGASGSGSSGSTNGNATSGSGSGNGNGKGKGPNKRVHSELTPLPEEVDGADGAGGSRGSSPLSSVEDSPPVPTRKKGRSTAAVESPSKKRGTAGAGRAPASARKVRAKKSVDTEPTRRSTRARR
ncbi:CAMK/RAD53 protein kinase [Mycena belliarum]|uniref:CAMK/RAD53 protein kinase n=1 Tax=Mycena belliarum TaxID=1033014 RepID=A0AAD6XTR6_9AGAR|nr:CAMK/RAD53 protein kinase [Mycena belliae]